MELPIRIDKEEIAVFCRRHHDAFTLSRQIPIERAPLSRRWPLILMVFVLSAAGQAQPPLGLPSADPASVGMSADALAALPAKFAHLVDHGKVPGFVTVVAREGKVVHFEAFVSATSNAGNR